MSPVIQSAAARRSALTPVAAPGRSRPGTRAAARQAETRRRTPGAKKIVLKELPAFSRQLAAMLSAGMPIVTSLEALEGQTSNKNFKPVIRNVRLAIEGGSSLSEALRMFPAIFDELFVNMVMGGETGGKLPETIARIASFLESAAKLRRRIKSAMAYPVIVMVIAVVISVLMLMFIVPVFEQMFAEFEATLPAPTQALINLSEFLKKYILIIVPVFVVGIIIFKKWRKTPAGALVMDRFFLRMPVVGDLVQKVAVARFSRTFSQLIQSGVPILQALDIAAGATGNMVVSNAIRDGCAVVERGEPLSSAMVGKSCFPPMLVHMLQAGEKTGKVDEMMDKIAEFYEDEIDAALAGLMSLIEPLLMVFLGVTIGGMVVCMFLPMFKLPSVIQF